MVRPQRVELCVEPYKDPPQNRRGQGVYKRRHNPPMQTLTVWSSPTLLSPLTIACDLTMVILKGAKQGSNLHTLNNIQYWVVEKIQRVNYTPLLFYAIKSYLQGTYVFSGLKSPLHSPPVACTCLGPGYLSV